MKKYHVIGFSLSFASFQLFSYLFHFMFVRFYYKNNLLPCWAIIIVFCIIIDLFRAYKYLICDVFHWFCKVARFFATEPLLIDPILKSTPLLKQCILKSVNFDLLYTTLLFSKILDFYERLFSAKSSMLTIGRSLEELSLL